MSLVNFVATTCRRRLILTSVLSACFLFLAADVLAEQSPTAAQEHRQLLDRYCVTCHNDRLETAGLSLEAVDLDQVGVHAELLEKVVRKLRTGTMPPSNRPQPEKMQRQGMVDWLEGSLDAVAETRPNPGRTDTLRRLNRTEYANAVRDLLDLEIDATELLPPDESGYGFDNVTVGDLSPMLLDRYISAAQRISRLAIGTTQTSLQSEVVRIAQDVTQEKHVVGLPIGTRGGASIPFNFVQDGQYDIEIRLARNREGLVGGLRQAGSHTLELLLDREHLPSFVIEQPPDGDDHSRLDEHLKARVAVTAGPHDIGVTFIESWSSLLETERQPGQSQFNETRHPRITPAVYEVSITGPYEAFGASATPARERLFVCEPGMTDEEETCAQSILSTVMQRAYRRPVTQDDIAGAMAFYREGRAEGGFDAGIGNALSSVLVNPSFLFRVEFDPTDVDPDAVYEITDLELASRLSFFLWSSIPDDELLATAISGELSDPEELERQTLRLLRDPRSNNLASNFAGQWLRLRNLEAVSPNPRMFPDFDDNLRQAFRQETELFIDSVLKEDRSVLDLLDAKYTFLNERLAKHYGIAGIYGSRFRRVELGLDSKRGGLLRHGSVLSVTSYATRTSPVIRGVWVLDNIYGAPPPPPLPNVPALEENSVAANLTMRDRLAQHRNNAVCASCHRTIDPVGFSMENFDAIGRWRESDGDNGPIDASGGLPGVGDFSGVAGLETGLLSRPEMFANALTEKLMVFGLGRGLDYYDAPAVRKILREAEVEGYRFSSLILGIVKSIPFQMRKST